MLHAVLNDLADGMMGRLPELSEYCKIEGNAWISPSGEGHHPWEEVPYWLRGFGDLGYVLQDERITREARRWIDGILSTQRPDGYFGPEDNRRKRDLWPNMTILNTLQTFYEATGDARVLPFMAKYFRWQMSIPKEELLPDCDDPYGKSWQKIRAGDNLESIYWLYNRTGEAWLLEAAKLIHERASRWDRGVADWHGVNICQGFREPATFYLQSKNRDDFDASERDYQVVMMLYGQVPGGMFGADENCRPGHHGPRQGAEACSMVEVMHSDQMLLGISGEPVYADRCEDVAFNSLPAAMTADYKGLHYITSPNQPQMDHRSKSPGVENGGVMMPYSPHLYRCCQHNVVMGWPYYAEHLWMATLDHGLAAVLYVESAVKAKVADGVEVTITETTGYPFEEAVELTLSAPKAVSFPLYLRVPGWCEGATLTINGVKAEAAPRPSSYLRIERSWGAHEDRRDNVADQRPLGVGPPRAAVVFAEDRRGVPAARRDGPVAGVRGLPDDAVELRVGVGRPRSSVVLPGGPSGEEARPAAVHGRCGAHRVVGTGPAYSQLETRPHGASGTAAGKPGEERPAGREADVDPTGLRAVTRFLFPVDRRVAGRPRVDRAATASPRGLLPPRRAGRGQRRHRTHGLLRSVHPAPDLVAAHRLR